MRIYLDFDNTLVATRTFFEEYYRPLLENLGSTAREIEVSYRSFATGVSLLGELFTPERQMTILGWPASKKENALAQIENILREKRAFIFSDVVNTLQALRNQGHTLILLTFGDQQFQKQKIVASGIGHFFDEVIITQGDKVKILLEDQEKNIVFVDDRIEFLERLVGTDIQTMHMCRKEIQAEGCMRCEAYHEITTIEDLLKYL